MPPTPGPLVDPLKEIANSRAVSANADKVTASLDVLGRCPVCNELMIKATSCGVPALVCLNDKVVLPDITVPALTSTP